MSVQQLLFAVSDSKGMNLVAASFASHDADAWDGWNEKLRSHVRLLGELGTTPSTSFSHLSFPDGTAALLRRSARPGDVGRNVAHALVSDRRTIARLVPAMTCWSGWLDDRPRSNQLHDVDPAEFTGQPDPMDDPMLLPIFARVLAWPTGAYSVIGVPEGLELPVMWALRAVKPDREWTFSTYEQDDTRPNLPRVVFLSRPPSPAAEAQEERQRIDVREAPRANDWATKPAEEWLAELRQVDPAPIPAFDDTPTVIIGEPVREEPHATWPAPDLVHGDAPLPHRLVQFAELAAQIDGEAWHDQICAWIEDRVNAPDPFVATFVQAQRAKGYTGFDAAISRRWLAEQGVEQVRHPVAEPARMVARPPVDERLARKMWGKHEAWCRSANMFKRRAGSYRLGVLGTLAGSAVLTVVAAQFNASWPPVASIGAAVVTAALVMLGIWFRAVKEPAERMQWTRSRIVAEQVKAEVCKYLAGATPYRDRRAVALLTENIARFEGGEPMHEAAGETPLIYDLRSYVDNRVRDQISYHRATARRLQRNLRHLRLAEYVFQGMAAALAAVGAVQGYQLAVWAGLLTTIAGAVTAHIAQTGYDRLIVRFHRTVHDLEELARTLPERPDPALEDTFVTGCEQVIARQNDDWLAQLTTSGKQSG
ncbi:hypothetical protein UK23_41355 [Lentzea aerocolonigenes]|uniref:SMODS and SLOG-associating 2TM effector domain-containing protein n=1 Tax=Lentzea aerocolonigenes TaxID=68170 RepID=A0A0F0GI35_LENAE|nr:DUF4231 domain-containing protein [Lentzea aerocolonigenes]KJK38102.1 hypothetical protein UK23_41355 [Lentzea aerocolonigenes]